MLEILSTAAIGVLWINSYWGIKIRSYLPEDSLFTNLLSCCLCSTWWITFLWFLVTTGGFYIGWASIAAIIAELVSRKISQGL